MAKTAAERRAARKRKDQYRGRHRGADVEHEASAAVDQLDPAALVEELILAAAGIAVGRDADGTLLDVLVGQLVLLDPGVDSAQRASGLLVRILRQLWEAGWQPLDVVHVVPRQGTQRLGRLAVAVIAHEAQSCDAFSRAPAEWTAQLSEIGATGGGDGAVLSRWARAEELDAAEAWRETARLIGALSRLPTLALLGPPPSQWDRARPRRPAGRDATASTAPEPKILGRIRALLAKAESTGFPDEAEALTAKAQDLMTRYAIDAAILDAEHGASLTDEVRTRRLHIDDPYSEAKVQLLDSVARANSVRVIWLKGLSIGTVVGLPVDLDLTELLFTSLLVQATRAMAAAGRAGTRQTRSPSFRRAFLISYGLRIRERLTEVHDQVSEEVAASYGAALVPVLRERAQAVDDVFAALFPDTVKITSRAVDARGWHAGRLAAEHADLGSGREQVTR